MHRIGQHQEDISFPQNEHDTHARAGQDRRINSIFSLSLLSSCGPLGLVRGRYVCLVVNPLGYAPLVSLPGWEIMLVRFAHQCMQVYVPEVLSHFFLPCFGDFSLGRSPSR